MKIYEFPFVFEAKVKQDLQADIRMSESQSDLRIINLKDSLRGKQPGQYGLPILGSLGMSGGLIACTCVSCVSCEGDIWGTPDLGRGFLTLIIWSVIGFVLGLLIDFAAKKSWEGKVNQIDKLIEDEIHSKEEYIENEINKCEHKCKQYTEAFEKTAQEMSIRFAASSLAQSAISWMTSGFCRTIDAADRRPHINIIEVPFVFDVYAYKITCNLGTFDFELQRCRNLNSPLEQTALARAIASSVQLNVMKKYSQDVTGSTVDVSISFSYAQDRPIVTVSYIAQNFNYEPVADWEDEGN